MSRIETGPVQFGDDWCGVFIRGDNAAYFAMCLRQLLQESADNSHAKVICEGLQQLLQSCLGNPEEAQKMKSFTECEQPSAKE